MRFASSLLLTAAAAALLSGCAASPPPLLITPETIAKDAGLVRPEEIPGKGIGRTVAAGLANNPWLRILDADARKGDAILEEAAAQGGITANLDVGSSSTDNPSGATSQTSRSTHVSAGIGAVLYDGGLKDAHLVEARFRASGAQALLISGREGRALDIAVSAIHERHEQDLLARTAASAKAGKKLQGWAITRQQLGAGHEVDVKSAGDHLDEIDARKTEATRKLTTARAELEAQTGLSDHYEGEIDALGPLLPKTLDEAVEQAMASNPEVVATEATIAALHAARDAIEIEATHPQIKVGISPTIASGMASMFGLGSIFADITMPLFDNGRAVAKMREIDAEIAKAEAEQEKARRVAKLNVKSAWASMIAARETEANAAKRQRTNESINRDIAAGYDAGQQVFFDLVGGEERLFRAQVTEIDARYTLLEAEYRLAKETGRLTEVLGISTKSLTVQAIRERLAAKLHEKDAPAQEAPREIPRDVEPAPVPDVL